MIFITISEKLNYQFVFLFSSYFSKLYVHYTLYTEPVILTQL